MNTHPDALRCPKCRSTDIVEGACDHCGHILGDKLPECPWCGFNQAVEHHKFINNKYICGYCGCVFVTAMIQREGDPWLKHKDR